MQPATPPERPTHITENFARVGQDVRAQRETFGRSVGRWGLAVVASTLTLLTVMLLLFFDTTYITPSDTAVGLRLLLIAPFTGLVVFSLNNHFRARKYREKYLGKELIARTLPASLRLLRSEFPEHTSERLQFALHNLQTVYDEAIPSRKRSYNIGINKIFRVGWSEDESPAAREHVIEGATTKAVNKAVAKS